MNTLRTTWGTARITAVALTVLLLATCSGGVTGIFYTLATQTSRADRNLPNNVAFNVVRAGDRFYVAALSLYSTGKIGDKWSTVNHPPPSGAEVVNVLSLAYHPDNDGHLYAGFLFDGAGDTDTFGLYRAELTNNALTWLGSPVSGIDGKQVVRLLVAGPTLLAITKDGDAWELHRLLEDTGSFTAVTLPAAAGRVHDVAYDGSAYWVTTEGAVYQGDINGKLTKDGPSGSGFVGVVSYVNMGKGRVYISDNSGNVHWHDGAEWVFQAITPNDEPLTEFIYLKDRNQILVGTESLGFYSFKADNDKNNGSPTEVTRHPHFANEALYNAHVQRFAYLPKGDPGTIPSTCSLSRSPTGCSARPPTASTTGTRNNPRQLLTLNC